jgi:NitT/TauT family transport system permease protein
VNFSTKGFVAPMIALTVLGLLWQWAVGAFHIQPYLLPSPVQIGSALWEQFPTLTASALITLRTALLALLLASLTGMSLAAICGWSPIAEQVLRPFAVAAQVTPVVAIAPLLLIWSGLDHPERAMIALATIVAFFPIYSGSLAGLKSAEPDLEALFRLYDAKPLQTLIRLRIPSAVPQIVEGHKVASGLALIGAVVAEFAAGSGSQQGLAWRILEAGNRLETAKMFAALIILAALGSGLQFALTGLEVAILKAWRGR